MKYLYSFLLVLSLSFYVNAQALGVNFSGAVPMGDYSDAVNLGYSGGLSFFLPIAGFTGVIYAGYGFWDEQDNPSATDLNFTNFPVVLAGARKYFGKTFYGSVLAGIYPVKASYETSDGKVEEKETQGALCPGVGLVFPVSFFWLDLSANYLWTQDYQQAQFGLGFVLEL